MARLDEEEVAGFMDAPPAEAELPVDGVDLSVHGERPEPRLLSHLAERSLRGRLARLDVALRKSPVAIRVTDQQDERALPVATEDDPAGGDLLMHALRLAHP